MSYHENEARHQPARAATGIEQEFAEREAMDRRAETWRHEVASRVEGYRVRRSKKTLAGDYSMKLEFEPRVPARGSALPVEYFPTEPAPEPPAPPPPPHHAETVRPPAPRPQVPPESAFSEPATRPVDPPSWPAWVQPKIVFSSSLAEPKVIEFPRPLLFPEMHDPAPADPYELAEPMLQTPRILDVPETVSVSTPQLAGVALEAPDEDDDLVEDAGFDLPLQVASLARRVLAAVVDSIAVAAYLAVFILVVLRGVQGLALSKPMLAMGLAIPLVLWSAYQYLFLVHSKQTPGMQLAGLRVSNFEGKAAPRGRRRWRALMLVLSFVSLGFGFWWALFDEDHLCWHDRLTRTYLTAAR